MGMCNLNTKVNIKNEVYLSPLKCKQCDTLILDFQVWDGSLLADVNGWSCMLRANKNNGMGYQIEEAEVTASNSNIHIECKSTLTQFAGVTLLECTFNKGNLQKTSFDIEILVRKSVLGNSDGSVPECIITPLEKLDENLAKISESINAADAAKTALDNSKVEAEKTNSKLITNDTNAKNTNTTLVTNTTEAKSTIEELKKTNSEYTQHIKNMDIHVTLEQKKKWDSYEAKITELTNIIDDVIYKDATVVDDEGNTIIDDEGNIIII